MEMDRDALRDYLLENNVPFHRSAHIDVLRSLYLNHVHPVEESVEEAAAPPDVPIEDASAEGRNTDAQNPETGVAGAQPSIARAATTPASAEEAELIAELRVLELRQRIASLRRTLAESSGANYSDSSANSVFRPSFKDIEHSVALFSGNDAYDAHKWLDDLNRACASVNGDDTFKLNCARRLMKPDSDAEIFLRTDNSATFNEFRQQFLQTFGHIYSVSEIIDKLNKTKFRPSEMTIMGYILRMQEIASRAPVDEKLLIRCIIDGLQDRSVHVAVLYPAQNLQQLKDLAHTYQHLRERNTAAASSIVPRPKPDDTTKLNSEIKCFNCSGVGHRSNVCPLPKRTQ